MTSRPYFPQNCFQSNGQQWQPSGGNGGQAATGPKNFTLPWIAKEESMSGERVRVFFNQMWRRLLIYYHYVHRNLMYQRALEALESDQDDGGAHGEYSPFSTGDTDHVEFLERMARDGAVALASFARADDDESSTAENEARVETLRSIFAFVSQGLSLVGAMHDFIDRPGHRRVQNMRGMSSVYSTTFTFDQVRPHHGMMSALVPDPPKSANLFRFLVTRILVHMNCCVGTEGLRETEFVADIVERVTLLQRVTIPDGMNDDVPVATAAVRSVAVLVALTSVVAGRHFVAKHFVRALRVRQHLQSQLTKALRSQQIWPSIRNDLAGLLPQCAHNKRQSHPHYFFELKAAAQRINAPGWSVIGDLCSVQDHLEQDMRFCPHNIPPAREHFGLLSADDFVRYMYRPEDAAGQHTSPPPPQSQPSGVGGAATDPRKRPREQSSAADAEPKRRRKETRAPEKDMSQFIPYTDFVRAICDSYLERALKDVDEDLAPSISKTVNNNMVKALNPAMRGMYDTNRRTAIVTDNDFPANTSPIVSLKYNMRGAPIKTNKLYVRRDSVHKLKELLSVHCLDDKYSERLGRSARSALRAELRVHNVPKDIAKNEPLVAPPTPPSTPDIAEADASQVENMPVHAANDDFEASTSIPFSDNVAHMVEMANANPVEDDDNTASSSSSSSPSQTHDKDTSDAPPPVSPARPPVFFEADTESGDMCSHRSLPTMSIVLGMPDADDRSWAQHMDFERLRFSTADASCTLAEQEWRALNDALVNVLRTKVYDALKNQNVVAADDVWRYCFGIMDYENFRVRSVEWAEDKSCCLMSHSEEQQIKMFMNERHGMQVMRTGLQICVDPTRYAPLFVGFERRADGAGVTADPIRAFQDAYRKNAQSTYGRLPLERIANLARLHTLEWMYWHDPTKPANVNDQLFALLARLADRRRSRMQRLRVLNWVERNRYSSSAGSVVHNVPQDSQRGVTPIRRCHGQCGRFTRLICAGVNTQRAKLSHRQPVPVCKACLITCHTCQKTACRMLCYPSGIRKKFDYARIFHCIEHDV